MGAQSRQLARHEQALQILVLDHLREVEARRLRLSRGYGNLFALSRAMTDDRTDAAT